MQYSLCRFLPLTYKWMWWSGSWSLFSLILSSIRSFTMIMMMMMTTMIVWVLIIRIFTMMTSWTITSTTFLIVSIGASISWIITRVFLMSTGTMRMTMMMTMASLLTVWWVFSILSLSTKIAVRVISTIVMMSMSNQSKVNWDENYLPSSSTIVIWIFASLLTFDVLLSVLLLLNTVLLLILLRLRHLLNIMVLNII